MNDEELRVRALELALQHSAQVMHTDGTALGHHDVVVTARAFRQFIVSTPSTDTAVAG